MRSWPNLLCCSRLALLKYNILPAQSFVKVSSKSPMQRENIRAHLALGLVHSRAHSAYLCDLMVSTPISSMLSANCRVEIKGGNTLTPTIRKPVEILGDHECLVVILSLARGKL